MMHHPRQRVKHPPNPTAMEMTAGTCRTLDAMAAVMLQWDQHSTLTNKTVIPLPHSGKQIPQKAVVLREPTLFVDPLPPRARYPPKKRPPVLCQSQALYMARVIHYDLTLAHASSWQWWLAISPYDYKDGLVCDHCLSMQPDRFDPCPVFCQSRAPSSFLLLQRTDPAFCSCPSCLAQHNASPTDSPGSDNFEEFAISVTALMNEGALRFSQDPRVMMVTTFIEERRLFCSTPLQHPTPMHQSSITPHSTLNTCR